LVNRLRQSRFAAAAFDSGRFNLHVSPEAQRRTLVVLVHGLSGSGYKTWGDVPERLFSGADGPPVDVGIYDYRSGLRRLGHGAADFGIWVAQLEDQLRDLEGTYSDIFLVGHSLGGLLIEELAVSYLRQRAQNGQRDAGALAALVLIASPRAGSGWAVPLLGGLIYEFRLLRRLNSRSAEVDAYFATYVERLNVVEAAPGRIVLPVYAVIGGSDRLVSRFSAAFGVPTPQRRHLDAGHVAIVKPRPGDSELTGWLRRNVLNARLGVRQQAIRQLRHDVHRPALSGVDSGRVVITQFMTDSSGLLWEEIYNEARRSATTATMAVRDARDVPGNDIDLLIAVYDTALVLADDPAVHAAVLHAVSRLDRQGSMAMGICPVGADFLAAEATVRQWLHQCSPTASVYVNGASDVTGLRATLARLLHLVIGRDPRHDIRGVQAVGWPDDLNARYDDQGRGGF
jgi:predicted alpha/beta hydrolase family esterase